jgi:Outer membrane lipoprotein-sorting protein
MFRAVLLAAAMAAAPTDAEVQSWLAAVDQARQAFGEARITARATQIVDGKPAGTAITKNQRLMGGASFGDVASMRLAEDYTAVLRPETENLGDRPAYVLDLTAKSPKAPYPKVTLWLDTQDRRARKLLFFLPSGREGREATFTKFRKIGDKTAVAEMEVVDKLGPNAGEVTRLEYLDIQPAKIDDKVFTPEGAKAM